MAAERDPGTKADLAELEAAGAARLGLASLIGNSTLP